MPNPPLNLPTCPKNQAPLEGIRSTSHAEADCRDIRDWGSLGVASVGAGAECELTLVASTPPVEVDRNSRSLRTNTGGLVAHESI